MNLIIFKLIVQLLLACAGLAYAVYDFYLYVWWTVYLLNHEEHHADFVHHITKVVFCLKFSQKILIDKFIKLKN